MVKPKNMDKVIIKLMAMVKLEDKLTESMSDFGDEHVVTLSDATRKLRKEYPEVLEKIRELIKLVDAEKGGDNK